MSCCFEDCFDVRVRVVSGVLPFFVCALRLMSRLVQQDLGAIGVDDEYEEIVVWQGIG